MPGKKQVLGKSIYESMHWRKEERTGRALTALGSLRPTYSTRLPVRMKTEV